jgi:hypothetical protein
VLARAISNYKSFTKRRESLQSVTLVRRPAAAVHASISATTYHNAALAVQIYACFYQSEGCRLWILCGLHVVALHSIQSKKFRSQGIFA